MPTFVVTTLDDEDNLDNGFLSLREALALASASGEFSTISFDSSFANGTIALGGNQLVVASNVKIDGDINADGSADITISAEGLSRVMSVNSNLSQVELNGLVLTGGQGIGGGGGLAIGLNSNATIRHSVIRDNAENGSGGGGIYGSTVTLTIEDSTITGNSSSTFGGGIRLVGAGSVLNVVNSTVSNNVTTGGGAHGGGIQYAGLSLHIENSTISGNAVQGAGSIGGGLRITTSDSATIYNSTIVGNAASASAGGVSANGVNDTFVNVVVAGNTSGAGASAATGGSPLASGGSPDDVSGVIENSTHSYFGTTVTITNDVNSYVNQGIGSLFLGNLQNNGGYVETHALLEGSALINAGSTADLPTDLFDIDSDGDVAEPLSLDGRGGGRVAGSSVDIGAFEYNRAPVVANSIADQMIDEDTPWSFVVPAVTFSDADGDTLVLSATLDDDSALPPWLSFDGTKFTGTPPQDFNGTIDLKVTASDGGTSVSDGFILTVGPVNDAPAGSATADLADGRLGQTYTISEADLLVGFSDPDGDTLTVENLSASEGTLTDNGDGTWTWQPPLFFTGEVDLAYQVSDGTTLPIDANQSFDIVLPPDDGGEEPPVLVIEGTPGADNLPGTDGDDVFAPLEGDDDVFGGDGDDAVILPGETNGYVFVQLANGKVGVVDIDPSDGDQGSDVLDGVELIRVGDENAADTPLAGLIDMDQPDWTLDTFEVELVASTWQLFMQMVPSGGGFKYLIDSHDNPTDLGDAYFASFNAENKYLSFASNLATEIPAGMAWFDREFGGLTYEQAIDKAFDLIITDEALEAAGGDPEASKAFFLGAKDFYETVAEQRIVRDGVTFDEAVKVALVSSVLYEAVKADIGPYAEAVSDFAKGVQRVGTSTDFLESLLAA